MSVYIYARVSTKKQSLAAQIEELHKVYEGAVLVTDKESGVNLNRSGFARMNNKLMAGDVVIIYDLSRLGRNTSDLLLLIDDWNCRGVGLVVHNLGGMSVDTRSASGRLMFTIVAAFGESQRMIQREKSEIGMRRAIKDGKMKGGRPHKTEEIRKAIEHYEKCKKAGIKCTKEQAAKVFNVGVASLYRAMNGAGK